MFNFITLKKKTLIFLFIIVFIMIGSIYLNAYLKNLPSSYEVYSNIKNNNEFDFDCDGENDELTIISTNTTYSIKIKNSTGESLLKSQEYDYSLLDIAPSCDISISYIDLSRNKIPELIISGIKNNKPAFYIFRWIDNAFQEVIFSQDNILGILDYNNSRTPKIFTANSTKGDESTKGYIINSTYVKDITFSNPKIPAFGNIQKLIDLIQVEYELDDAPDIFTSYIPSEELGLLWNLDKLNYRYSFQKAYFYDTTWNDDGKPTSLYWVLSFEKINYTTSNKKPQELILYVKTELDELDQYKISSIIKK